MNFAPSINNHEISYGVSGLTTPLEIKNKLARRELGDKEYIPDALATDLQIVYKPVASQDEKGLILNDLIISHINLSYYSPYSTLSEATNVYRTNGGKELDESNLIKSELVSTKTEKNGKTKSEETTRKYTVTKYNFDADKNLDAQCQYIEALHQMLERNGVFNALKHPSLQMSSQNLQSFIDRYNQFIEDDIMPFLHQKLSTADEKTNEIINLEGCSINEWQQILVEMENNPEIANKMFLISIDSKIEALETTTQRYEFMNDEQMQIDIHSIPQEALNTYCLGQFYFAGKNSTAIQCSDTKINQYLCQMMGVTYVNNSFSAMKSVYEQYLAENTNCFKNNPKHILKAGTGTSFQGLVSATEVLRKTMELSQEQKSHNESQMKDINIQLEYFKEVKKVFEQTSDSDKSKMQALIDAGIDVKEVQRCFASPTQESFDKINTYMGILKENVHVAAADLESNAEFVKNTVAAYNVLDDIRKNHPLTETKHASRDDIRLIEEIKTKSLLTGAEAKTLRDLDSRFGILNENFSVDKCFDVINGQNRKISPEKIKEEFESSTEKFLATLTKYGITEENGKQSINADNASIRHFLMSDEGRTELSNPERNVFEILETYGLKVPSSNQDTIKNVLEEYRISSAKYKLVTEIQSIVDSHRVSFTKFDTKEEINKGMYSEETIKAFLSNGAFTTYEFNPTAKEEKDRFVTTNLKLNDKEKLLKEEANRRYSEEISRLSNPKTLAEEVLKLRETSTQIQKFQIETGRENDLDLQRAYNQVQAKLSFLEEALKQYIQDKNLNSTLTDGKNISPEQNTVERINSTVSEFLNTSTNTQNEFVKNLPGRDFVKIFATEEKRYEMNENNAAIEKIAALYSSGILDENTTRKLIFTATSSHIDGAHEDKKDLENKRAVLLEQNNKGLINLSAEMVVNKEVSSETMGKIINPLNQAVNEFNELSTNRNVISYIQEYPESTINEVKSSIENKIKDLEIQIHEGNLKTSELEETNASLRNLQVIKAELDKIKSPEKTIVEEVMQKLQFRNEDIESNLSSILSITREESGKNIAKFREDLKSDGFEIKRENNGVFYLKKGDEHIIYNTNNPEKSIAIKESQNTKNFFGVHRSLEDDIEKTIRKNPGENWANLCSQNTRRFETEPTSISTNLDIAYKPLDAEKLDTTINSTINALQAIAQSERTGDALKEVANNFDVDSIKTKAENTKNLNRNPLYEEIRIAAVDNFTSSEKSKEALKAGLDSLKSNLLEIRNTTTDINLEAIRNECHLMFERMRLEEIQNGNSKTVMAEIDAAEQAVDTTISRFIETKRDESKDMEASAEVKSDLKDKYAQLEQALDVYTKLKSFEAAMSSAQEKDSIENNAKLLKDNIVLSTLSSDEIPIKAINQAAEDLKKMGKTEQAELLASVEGVVSSIRDMRKVESAAFDQAAIDAIRETTSSERLKSGPIFKVDKDIDSAQVQAIVDTINSKIGDSDIQSNIDRMTCAINNKSKYEEEKKQLEELKASIETSIENLFKDKKDTFRASPTLIRIDEKIQKLEDTIQTFENDKKFAIDSLVSGNNFTSEDINLYAQYVAGRAVIYDGGFANTSGLNTDTYVQRIAEDFVILGMSEDDKRQIEARANEIISQSQNSLISNFIEKFNEVNIDGIRSIENVVSIYLQDFIENPLEQQPSEQQVADVIASIREIVETKEELLDGPGDFNIFEVCKSEKLSEYVGALINAGMFERATPEGLKEFSEKICSNDVEIYTIIDDLSKECSEADIDKLSRLVSDFKNAQNAVEILNKGLKKEDKFSAKQIELTDDRLKAIKVLPEDLQKNIINISRLKEKSSIGLPDLNERVGTSDNTNDNTNDNTKDNTNDNTKDNTNDNTNELGA